MEVSIRVRRCVQVVECKATFAVGVLEALKM